MCLLYHSPSFFFNDTATTGIYTYGHTLSLHDALPTSWRTDAARLGKGNIEGAALLEWFLDRHFTLLGHETWMRDGTTRAVLGIARNQQAGPMLAEASRHLALAWFEKRSEEHTSELQSLMRISYAVFCLKKKKKYIINTQVTYESEVQATCEYQTYKNVN